MRFLLKYYYLLDNPTISRKNNHIYIKANDKKYLLCKIENVTEFNEMASFLEEKNANNLFYRVIKTVQNSFYVFYQQTPYALIEVNDNRVNIFSAIENINNRKVDYVQNKYQYLNRSNWYFLWAKKNDYFSNISTHHENTIINEQLDYCIGLAETAIQYLSEVHKNKSEQESLYITHKRINLNTILNPMYLVVDRKERDISEYIKYLYFNNEYSEEKISYILEKIKKEKLSIELIYARLLYPTHFFDSYESEESNRINLLKSKEIQLYEEFLKNIHIKLSKIKKIKKVDWL